MKTLFVAKLRYRIESLQPAHGLRHIAQRYTGRQARLCRDSIAGDPHYRLFPYRHAVHIQYPVKIGTFSIPVSPCVNPSCAYRAHTPVQGKS
jgi:hypothetical protein